MKLRQKSKRDQALDAVASVAKTWSEWRLGKRATKTVAKGAKKASSLKGIVKSTPVRIAGAVALVGGVGAAVAKKLKGGGEPDYTPPPPAPAPMPPVADVPPAPPTPVVVEDLSSDAAAAPEPEAIAEPAADEDAAPDDDGDPDAAASADAPAEGRL